MSHENIEALCVVQERRRLEFFQSMDSKSPQKIKLHGCYTRRVIRSIGIALVIALILLGLALIINWLILLPKKVVVTVEKGHIRSHTITDTRINGTFELQIKCFNPNRKASIHYEWMTVAATYLDQKVLVSIEPFSQHPRNETNFDIRFDQEFVSPFGNMKRDITRDGFKFSLRIKAKIRFKLRQWVAKGRLVDIFCPSVVEYIDSTRIFERVSCQIDL